MTTQAPPRYDFQADHVRLRKDIDEFKLAARELPALGLEERELLVARIIAFLEREVIPHSDAEEYALYPALERLLGEHALGRMIRDHVVIADFVDELQGADVSQTTELQETLYDLQGVLDLHFEKEEQIYLPLLAQLPPAIREAVDIRMARVHTDE